MVAVNAKVKSVLQPLKGLASTLMVGTTSGMVGASEIVKESSKGHELISDRV
jgi:hypothetical protein